jgi:hypothetical protein
MSLAAAVRWAIALSLVALARPGLAAPRRSACQPGETAVVVELQAHRLTLCARGRVEGELDVALGTGGLGKRVAGDNRTPIGVYGLGALRVARYFHPLMSVE